MRTFQSQSHRAQRGAASSSSSSNRSHTHSFSLSVMSPLTLVSISTAALLLLTASGCQSAPAEQQQDTTDQRQLLSQIYDVCSSYLSAEVKIWASDPLGELCVLMLVQKSKELKTRESKRAELEGPGGIQSRGYFLYRPRNGRRSLEVSTSET